MMSRILLAIWIGPKGRLRLLLLYLLRRPLPRSEEEAVATFLALRGVRLTRLTGVLPCVGLRGVGVFVLLLALARFFFFL